MNALYLSVNVFSTKVLIGHLHDGVICYYDQNPLGFCFLVQIRAFVS